MVDQNIFEQAQISQNKLILSPESVEKLKRQGKIHEVFVTFDEHLDKIFLEIAGRRLSARKLIERLPRLDDSVANTTITAMFEELEQVFVLGMCGDAIDKATKLLEQATKYRLWDERRKVNKNAGWSAIEDMLLGEVIKELLKRDVLDEAEYSQLSKINKELRNPYAHTKVLELLKRHRMVLKELPAMNADTEEITIAHDIDPVQRPWLWFSAKKALDRDTFVQRVQECMFWVNKLLAS